MTAQESRTITVLTWLLESRAIAVSDIENWAMKRVERSLPDHRDDAMLELCSASANGFNATLSVLNSCKTKVGDQIWQTVFGVVSVRYRNGHIDLKTACRTIENLAIHGYGRGIAIPGSGIDDAYCLAESKTYGTMRDVESRVHDLTDAYQTLGVLFLESVRNGNNM